MTEQLIHTLQGAAQGISAAVEQETITPIQIYCLHNTLIQDLAATLHPPLTTTSGASQAHPDPTQKLLLLIREVFAEKFCTVITFEMTNAAEATQLLLVKPVKT